MMARFFNNHTVYEELLTEHLDGRLDAEAEAKLRAHAKGCTACRADMREMEALRGVLRAQPMVEPPRSFALPLTTPHPSRQPERAASGQALPGFMRWAGSGSVAMLRTMQMATAAAALVLVALVGLDVSGVTRQEPQFVVLYGQTDMPGAQGFRSAEADPPGMMTLQEPQGDPEGPSQDATIATDPAPAAPMEAPVEVPAPQPVEVVAVDPGRTAFEWAQLALSGLTALLALGVAAMSWAMFRHPV
jgi:anti-sigma factor RsiW